MLSMSSTSASTLPSGAPTATAFFAHQRDATSLQDLDIVRKIVEREGCLEALTQLLTTHARASHKDKGSLGASATLAAAPMVVNSLLDQLRSVGVQIVESIVKWKRLQPPSGSPHEPVFQWRGLNYLVKMLSDLDFLALHGATVAQLQAFQGLRLQRNPFVSPLHLDHAALLEPTAEMACRLSLFVGNVDMRRVWAACQTLLQEEQAEQAYRQQQSNTDAVEEGNATPVGNTTMTTRLHWSHRPMKLTISASSPTLRPLGSIALGDAATTTSSAQETMAFDVELAKELVFQHEHELGAMKEELAVLQRKLAKDLTIAPDKRRHLQVRIATLNNEVKQRSGDLFHRRNELQRKEAVLRMDKRRRDKANEFTRLLQQQQQLRQPASPHVDDEAAGSPPCELPERELSALAESTPHFTATETFRAALQADELRRQDLIEKLATHSKVRASLSVTKRKLMSLSPSPSTCSSPQHSRFAQVRPGSSGRGSGSGSGSISKDRIASVSLTASDALETMTCSQVETFVSGLGLGEDAARYGSLLRAQGIDGRLLAQAQDSDLEELGIPIRLHRLKILDATREATTN